MWVSNGVYEIGGRVICGTMTNRVAITRAIIVQSVNGPEWTIIKGAKDPATTNGDAAVRCVYVGTNALLSGFTLTNGATRTSGDQGAEQGGGGAWCESSGALSNCTISGNSAYYGGGGSYQGTLIKCTLSGNTAGWGGGGAYDGTLSNCVLLGNSAVSCGGGAHGGTLNSCLLSGNSGSSGGGARLSTLNNCVLSGNLGSSGGGALLSTLNNCAIVTNSAVDGSGGGVFDSTVNNCTISGNSAASPGGGAYQGTLKNCIVYFNSASTGPNCHEASLNYSCTTPNPGGTGNITNDPQFVDAVGGNYRLLSGSPCIDQGNNGYVQGTSDLDGKLRIINDAVDMGAYEFGVGVSTPAVPQPLGGRTGLVGQVLGFYTGGSTCSDGAAVEYLFDWGDGSYSEWSSSSNADHNWSPDGLYSIRARARCATNTSFLSGWSAQNYVLITNVPVIPMTHYVLSSGTAVPPYTNWETAAHSIQAAISVAAPSGARVVVGVGHYMECIDFLNKNIEVGSLFMTNGDAGYIAQTVIDGGHTGRVVNVDQGQTTASRLTGFTITNGYAGAANERGGGIRCVNTHPRLDHLVVVGNYANYVGGGIYLEGSTSSIQNVTFVGNSCDLVGGGVACYYGGPRLENVIIRGNQTACSGGGIQFYHATAALKNVVVAENVAGTGGGGMYFDGCSPTLEAVTIADNVVTNGHGGGMNVSYISQPVLIDSIIWGNTPEEVFFETSWFGMALTVQHSDIQGGEAGIVTGGKGPVYWNAGNLNDDPIFTADFGLQLGSPCINAGTNLSWMVSALDPAGVLRIIDYTVDMGAYEFTGGSTVTVSTPAVPQHLGNGAGLVGQVLQFCTGGSACSDWTPVQYLFDWGDGSYSEWSYFTNANHSWSQAGSYSLRARARCATNATILSSWSDHSHVLITNAPGISLTHYVLSSGTAVPPYTNWETAAHSIQAAIGVAATCGARVVVGVGHYTECIDFLNKNIEVGSLFLTSGDAGYIAQTVIDGGHTGRVVNVSQGQTAASRLTGFTITNGYAGAVHERGGGIRCVNAHPRLDHLVVAGNYANYVGGGIYLEGSTSSIQNVTFVGNSCDLVGGGIACYYGGPRMENVIIRGNRTACSGGGIQFYHAAAALKNVVVAENVAGTGGGGMYFDGCSPILEAVTIADNVVTNGHGGGMNVSYLSQPVLTDSIIWGNTPEEVFFETSWYGMALTVRYSDIQGGQAGIVTGGKGAVYWNAGNLDADPAFTADFGLQSGSPCINAGTNLSWMASALDLAGVLRIIDHTVDMGAYEFISNSVSPAVGSITCFIEPEEARNVGAQWRLIPGSLTNWLSSGQTIHVAAGDYTIDFQQITSWTEPGDTNITVGTGSNIEINVIYQPQLVDTADPVIVLIVPPDGHISNGNQIPMTILATDNVAVVNVIVNGELAVPAGDHVFHYTAKNVHGSFNSYTVVALDSMGNSAVQTVNYGQGARITLAALWDGYWRVRNPFSNDVAFTWNVYGSSESGSDVAPSNSDAFFSTTLGPKTVRLYTNGILIDTRTSSPIPPPQGALTALETIDSDADGLCNGDEETAGSDPSDTESLFELASASATSEVQVLKRGLSKESADGQTAVALFSWQSGDGSLYTIETSTNMVNWTAIPDATDIPGTGDIMSYTNSQSERNLFFLRIRAEKIH